MLEIVEAILEHLQNKLKMYYLITHTTKSNVLFWRPIWFDNWSESMVGWIGWLCLQIDSPLQSPSKESSLLTSGLVGFWVEKPCRDGGGGALRSREHRPHHGWPAFDFFQHQTEKRISGFSRTLNKPPTSIRLEPAITHSEASKATD